MTERGRISSEYRDVRIGKTEQRERPQRKKPKVDKPWIVIWSWGKWEHTFGRYVSRELAEQVIENQRRKCGIMSFRLKEPTT
jgi:hypothetical protein